MYVIYIYTYRYIVSTASKPLLQNGTMPGTSCSSELRGSLFFSLVRREERPLFGGRGDTVLIMYIFGERERERDPLFQRHPLAQKSSEHHVTGVQGLDHLAASMNWGSFVGVLIIRALLFEVNIGSLLFENSRLDLERSSPLGP